MKEVELTWDEVRHLEKVHRHGRDPSTKDFADSVLRRTHEVNSEGEVIYETICNHENIREPSENEYQKHKRSMAAPDRVCKDCGSIWSRYGQMLVSNESVKSRS